MKLLELLKQLFGQSYLNKIIGTRTNISKPIKMDRNSPYKLYSDKAFNDPDLLFKIEKKLEEYGPYVLSNKNTSEVSNFEMNARRALVAKNKGKVTTEKPEAEIVDIKTKTKVDDKGIMQLKDDLGLPEGVSPNSPMGKNLQELKKLDKEIELKKKDIDETLDKGLEDILKKELGKSGGLSANVLREGTRRPIIRQILAEDEEFRKMLSTEDYDDLLFGKDLDKGGDPNKDPLQYLNKFFERDIDQLDLLDELIDTMPGSTPAEISAEFKKRTGGLKLKNKKTVEDFRDEGALDPGGMAEGGRPGKGVDYLMGL